MNGIILKFREDLEVSMVTDLAPVFEDPEDTFVAVGGEFNGFYNLLRRDKRTIIGVEYYPFETDVGRVFSEFEYVSEYFSGDGNCELTFYFDNERGEVHDLTIVQEFGQNYIYRSQLGTLALSFGVSLETFDIA